MSIPQTLTVLNVLKDVRSEHVHIAFKESSIVIETSLQRLSEWKLSNLKPGNRVAIKGLTGTSEVDFLMSGRISLSLAS